MLCKAALMIELVYDDKGVFIQTDLSEAVLYFMGAIIRRLRHFFYSGD